MSDEISALLTQGQREYLKGESDIEPGTSRERAIRARIRKRLVRSVEDLALIHDHVEQRDIEKAFSDFDTHKYDIPASSLLLQGSLLIGASDGFVDPHQPTRESNIRITESIMKWILQEYYIRHEKRIKDIDIDINIEFGEDLEELNIEDVKKLSLHELTSLVRNGKVDFDSVNDIYLTKTIGEINKLKAQTKASDTMDEKAAEHLDNVIEILSKSEE